MKKSTLVEQKFLNGDEKISRSRPLAIKPKKSKVPDPFILYLTYDISDDYIPGASKLLNHYAKLDDIQYIIYNTIRRFLMNKSEIYKYPPNSAEYVVIHARYQRSRGRNPSLPFMSILNPTRALSLASRFAYFPVSGAYLNGTIPSDYKCGQCGTTGCKLWREYQTCSPQLLCARCAAVDQKKDISDIDADGKIGLEQRWKTDQIGWYVPCVPTEESGSYWGTSVPLAGCEWWRKLPFFSVAVPICPRASLAVVEPERGHSVGRLLSSRLVSSWSAFWRSLISSRTCSAPCS